MSGAGQPVTNAEGKLNRARGLYQTDKISQMKRSNENPVVATLYDGLLKNRTHDILHIER